jgi:hypothetical protein
VAQAIWDGNAVMGTDGSVKGSTATYSWIISTSDSDIQEDVVGGGLLPPPPCYQHHSSKRPEAAALYAGITWIQELLTKYPGNRNPISDPESPEDTPILTIYTDNKSVISDVQHRKDDLTPTFQFLRPDHDIIQGIQDRLSGFPIQTAICHVKSHQDRKKPYAQLSHDAQINVLADANAEKIYDKRQSQTGLFPSWIPGTRAALYRGPHQVSKDIPDYLRTAVHAPEMKAYLIRRSHEGNGRTAAWNNSIFNSIAWQPLGEAFNKMTFGQRIQLSKYMNDLLPTARRLQTLDNRNDGRCFACGLLWEDTNHVICCNCDARVTARADAFRVFRDHLTRQRTPDIVADLLCHSMQCWISRERIPKPTWTEPMETIQRLIINAFEAQNKIGWDQFIRGRVATAWKTVISSYYSERRPGESYSPDRWMRTTIDALWTFGLTLWRRRCKELHGEKSELSLEAKRKETATRAMAAYRDTIGQVSESDSLILHRARVTDMLNWTKQHLDAYLATAEVACEWNVEPG